MKRTLLFSLGVLTLGISLSGCFYSREISHLRHDIENHYDGADFDRGVVFSVGPRLLHTVGWIAEQVPEEEAQMAADYLDTIQNVKVGVYNVNDLPRLGGEDLPALERLTDDGWEIAVKTREDDEVVWVLYREHFDAVRGIYVVVLNDSELVVVRVNGYLDELLYRVMEDHGPLLDLASF